MLIAGLTGIFVVIALILVFLVDLTILAVSPAREAKIFSGWVPEDLVEVADGRLESVASIVHGLQSHWPDREYEIRVIVAEDEDANALAVPGGVIVVTNGLLDEVRSENELAFILGHEMGHFRNRDHLRGLGRGIAFSLMFAAISSSDGGADLGLAVADLTLRRFSRDQENDADRFGLELVQAQYGHVGESWRFFERLNEIDGRPGLLTTYLSTHPETGERIQQLQDYAREMNWPLAGRTVQMEWDN